MIKSSNITAAFSVLFFEQRSFLRKRSTVTLALGLTSPRIAPQKTAHYRSTIGWYSVHTFIKDMTKRRKFAFII